VSKASRKAWFDRHRQVNTWLEKKDYEELVERAKQAGMTLSTYVRVQLTGKE